MGLFYEMFDRLSTVILILARSCDTKVTSKYELKECYLMGKNRLAITIALMMALGTIFEPNVSTFGKDPAQDNFSLRLKDGQQQVHQEQGLHAAAKITGRYVYHTGPASHEQRNLDDPRFTLKSIFDYSEIVITGYVTNNSSKLYGPIGNEQIVTKYQVQVGEVIKGEKSLAGKTMVVNVSGGTVIFPDGMEVEESVAGRKMYNGGRYVLFLRQLGVLTKKSLSKKLLFTLGAGIFEITAEQKILFCGVAARPEKYNDYSVDDFLQEVRKLSSGKE
jgi:hypothetical protein